MKISIYIRNIECVPSGYYRVAQYFKNEDNATVHNVCPKKIYILKRNASRKNLIVFLLYYFVMLFRITFFLYNDIINKTDIIIVSKAFFPGITPYYVRYMLKLVSKNSKIIWDFDDNIFFGNEISNYQKNFLENNSYKIIAANEFLRSKISKNNRKKTIILPTTDGDFKLLDIDKIIAERKKTYDKNIYLVWVATGGNLKYIERILSSLDKAADTLKNQTGKQLILNIVCNKFPNAKTKNLKIENIVWSRERAIEYISRSHIGLMPLIDSQYTRGKAGFKLVQCMATGLPVISSSIGVNKSIVKNGFGFVVDDFNDTDKWIEPIISLSSDEKKYELFSRNSYRDWQCNFNYITNYNVLHKIISKRS